MSTQVKVNKITVPVIRDICPERTTLGIQGRDGAFAEYLTMPLRNLHLIDESLALDEAVSRRRSL
jgi:NADPH:quinone reductase-like Zn-dependent oxidoreductase